MQFNNTLRSILLNQTDVQYFQHDILKQLEQ